LNDVIAGKLGFGQKSVQRLHFGACLDQILRAPVVLFRHPAHSFADRRQIFVASRQLRRDVAEFLLRLATLCDSARRPSSRPRSTRVVVFISLSVKQQMTNANVKKWGKEGKKHQKNESYTELSNYKQEAQIGTARCVVSCQLKSCQLPRTSAETTYTTSPDQMDGMKLEI